MLPEGETIEVQGDLNTNTHNTVGCEGNWTHNANHFLECELGNTEFGCPQKCGINRRQQKIKLIIKCLQLSIL